MHAITAAGIVFTITKNCSRGELEGCSCSGGQGGKQRDWKWDGCSENVDFGSRITKQFLDALETGQDAKALVNLHNNLAGRSVRWCHCKKETFVDGFVSILKISISRHTRS